MRPDDPDPVQSLADQALDALVNQFARPLDFLRELVQNAIDAGSPRVDVWVAFVPDPEDSGGAGVVEVHVDDTGEGMDEEIIDSQLTRMFSSSKENDLTKIGKFGIGFTSIFAIEPDAVLLRTGRHGESWELLFHPDRSFDKVRIEEPVTGTRIALYKRMRHAQALNFARECRWVLTWWCEHSDTPIVFADRTGPARPPPAHAAPDPDSDPFAAFGAIAPDREASITRPLSIEADLAVEIERDGVRVVVGYAPAPRYGFYNGGLTLVNTSGTDVLEPQADRFAHLAFKIKSNALEHTLTRDNVLRDANWTRAMGVLAEAAALLRGRLLDRLDEAIAAREDPAPWHRYLATECRATRMHETEPDFRDRVALRDRHGHAVRLREIEAQEDRVGAVLFEPGRGALCEALEADGLHLLQDGPEARDLLAACPRRRRWSLRPAPRRLARAGELFALPEIFEAGELPPVERDLLREATTLLERAAGGRVALRLGNFGGAEAARELGLALEGPEDGGVFQRPGATSFRLPELVRRRCLVVNRHHPAWTAQVVTSVEHRALAALALVQAVLHEEGAVSESVYRAVLAAAAERLGEVTR